MKIGRCQRSISLSWNVMHSLTPRTISRRVPGSAVCFSTKNPSEDADKITEDQAETDRKDEVRSKLNDLLHSIKIEKPMETGTSPLMLSKPGRRPLPRGTVLSSTSEPTAAQEKPGKRTAGPAKLVGAEMAAAVRDVAAAVSGNPEQTEMELLDRLSGESTHPAKQPALNFADLMESMKVERNTVAPWGSLSDVGDGTQGEPGGQRYGNLRSVRRKVTKASRPSYVSHIDLNAGEPLHIFPRVKSKQSVSDDAAEMTTWQKLARREMQLSVTLPPANAWEEMIEWTKAGKLWPLPVDNELGLEKEASIGFQEHVLLERHLEPWCPNRGPIRQFMELVCVGLSKNYMFTVEEKRDHIEWFREYFISKQEPLQEIGAM